MNLKWINQTAVPIVMLVLLALTIIIAVNYTNKVSNYQKYSVRQRVVIHLNDYSSESTIADIQKNINKMTLQESNLQNIDGKKVFAIEFYCPPSDKFRILDWLMTRQTVEQVE